MQSNSLDSEYNKGYFLHLVTEYLFYNRYLTRYSKEIYRDYDKLNKFLIQKYDIVVPAELEYIIAFEEGEPQILDKKTISDFIEIVASIDIMKIKGKGKFLEIGGIEI